MTVAPSHISAIQVITASKVQMAPPLLSILLKQNIMIYLSGYWTIWTFRQDRKYALPVRLKPKWPMLEPIPDFLCSL